MAVTRNVSKSVKRGGMVFLTKELIFDVDVMLGIPDDLTVRILNAVLDGIQPAAPVRATSDHLGMDRALVSSRFRAQGRQRVLDVFTARKLGALDRDDVLVLPIAAFQLEPVHRVNTLVLVAFDEIPPQHEMFCDVVDTVAHDTHGYIVPWHAPEVGFTEFVVGPVLHVLKIHDSVVVEVLTGENFVLHAGRMHIGEDVLAKIPSPKTQIETTNKGELVVDDHEFLVVRLQTISHSVCGSYQRNARPSRTSCHPCSRTRYGQGVEEP